MTSKKRAQFEDLTRKHKESVQFKSSNLQYNLYKLKLLGMTLKLKPL